MDEVLFISKLPKRLKEIFRGIEKINKKIINKKSSLLFNNACLKNNIQPKYTNKSLVIILSKKLIITQKPILFETFFCFS